MPIGWTRCPAADSGSEEFVWFRLQWIRENDVVEVLRNLQETRLPDVRHLLNSQSNRLTVSLRTPDLNFRNCSSFPALPQFVSKFRVGMRNANPSARAAVIASAVKRDDGFWGNRYS
jgi:hypothetical protein